ncbi:hypothetical protein [Nocardioides sp.]|uniref:hypothetical protein n=1 Tax=Nocardioides sp. TaxID=35761 RepID=UPI002EDA022A
MLSAHLIALHMGSLHPIEQALTVFLAFGPFVLLGLVVWLRRRAERREDAAAEHAAAGQPAGAGGGQGGGQEDGQADR